VAGVTIDLNECLNGKRKKPAIKKYPNKNKECNLKILNLFIEVILNLIRYSVFLTISNNDHRRRNNVNLGETQKEFSNDERRERKRDND